MSLVAWVTDLTLELFFDLPVVLPRVLDLRDIVPWYVVLPDTEPAEKAGVYGMLASE